MSNTLLKSEVLTKMINEKMVGRGRLVQFAGDLGDLNNGVHQGDTYSILKVAHLSNMVDLTMGNPIPVEDIEVTKSSETVEWAGKGITIYDYEVNTTISGESMLDKKIQDMANLRIRKLEQSLGSKAVKAPLKYATSSTTSITPSELNNAITQAWGDSQDAEDFDGVVINSRLASEFYAMGDFVKSDLTHTTGGNGIVRNGCIGFYRGIPVYLSDVTTYDTTKNECITFILKKNALGFKKIAGEVELKREAEYKRTSAFDDMLYVTSVLDDTAICVLRKTIA